MSLTTLLDRLEPRCTGVTRSLLRKLVQDGLDELLDCDSPKLHWLGTDNQGFPPYLITVAGTVRYSITGANLSCGSTGLIISMGGTNHTVRARRILKVFVDVTSLTKFDQRWIGSPYVFSPMNPYSVATTRLEVADVPIDTYPATEDDPAYLMFKEDPGTSSTKYFCLFTWESPRLISDSIPLGVPSVFERALYDYVRGVISEDESGSPSDWTAKFLTYWKPRFQQEAMVLGAHSSSDEVQPRIC
jgi:hypothetical protein